MKGITLNGPPMRALALVPALVLIALLAGGCAGIRMKGTPFYTGEYEGRVGPVEDRINMWPALYYRKPALSMLWPIMELTEDHFALRPLMSVYDLEKDQRTYNVLWPLARFDGQTEDKRIFPAFWGEDYRTLFPLYWHKGHPFGEEGGYDTLLPLWSYRKDEKGYSTSLLWPLIHVQNRKNSQGWHIWPLVGNYHRNDDRYRFLLWPLGHQWEKKGGLETGHAFFPLYSSEHDTDGTRFLSLPYSCRQRPDGSGWKLVPPLFYHSRNYESSLFLSLLYSRGEKDDGTRNRWSLLTPFYLTRETEDKRLLLTLLGGYSADDNSTTWAAVPLLAGGRKNRSQDDTAPEWHTAIPFYYCRTSGDEKLLATILGGYQTGPQGQRWLIYPLLSGGKRGEDCREIWLAAPLCHVKTERDAISHHLLPLYYWNSRNRTFLSPLMSRWHNERGTTTVFPPALSWLSTDESRRDLWLAGPLAHFGWGEDDVSQHLFPLFYRSGLDGTLLSPLLAAWQQDGSTVRICPPLLSGYRSDGENRELGLLLGVFHNKWNSSGTQKGHLLPLYYYEKDKAFYTALFGWNNDRTDGFVYPVTPLAAMRKGKYSGGWIFPLFSHRRNRKTGAVSGTFLWGTYRRHKGKSRSGLFPLYNYDNAGSIESASEHPTRRATYGKKFFSFPACWYRNQLIVRPDRRPQAKDKATVTTARRAHGIFPLWSYSSRKAREEQNELVKGSILLALYDYKRKIHTGDEETNDYTRARILWRLWHYERSDGDVTVDLFPAITYDRKKDGFKKISFLWRLFRYESDKNGRKLDLLYVPILR